MIGDSVLTPGSAPVKPFDGVRFTPHPSYGPPLQDWEQELLAKSDGRTISVPIVSTRIMSARATVKLVDAITAVQDAGYLVYEKTELPEVTVVNGKPRLPARLGEVRPGTDKRTAFFEEGFGKLALAYWYEAEEARVAKRLAALVADITAVGVSYVDSERMAKHLAETGWTK